MKSFKDFLKEASDEEIREVFKEMLQKFGPTDEDKRLD